MGLSLGGFGDRRLEKGGPICWRGLCRMVGAGFGCGVWAGIALVRSASRGSCETRP